MDIGQIRLECLKVAQTNAPGAATPEILDPAKALADFVLSPTARHRYEYQRQSKMRVRSTY